VVSQRFLGAYYYLKDQSLQEIIGAIGENRWIGGGKKYKFASSRREDRGGGRNPRPHGCVSEGRVPETRHLDLTQRGREEELRGKRVNARLEFII